MTREGEAPVEGPWVDRVNGIEGVCYMRGPAGIIVSLAEEVS
jgi:hypothetical protein